MWAFYMAREAGQPRIEAPFHSDPASVIERELAHARKRQWAAEQIVQDSKGQRQHEASGWAIGLIHGALNGAPDPKPQIAVAYSEGTAFVKIVSICMAAAGGEKDRSYERWIRAYRLMMQAVPEDTDIGDGPDGQPRII